MLKSHISYGKFLNYFTIFVLLGKIYGGQAQCPGQNQNCIAIEKCPDLLRIWQKSMINPDELKLLESSRCGHSRKQYKVCCTAGNIDTSSRYNPPSDLLPAPGQCGKSLGQRIFGGNVAGLDEFQWMALIEFANPSGRRFLCGGALISNRYVLTAAHCVKNTKGLRIISVRLGEHNLDKDEDCEDYCADPPQNVPVEESIPYEDYDPKSNHNYHDIALLRLQRPVNFTDYIFPICLPSSLDTSYQGLNMTVAGWGATEYKSQSVEKMKVDVPIIPQQECKTMYQKKNRLLKLKGQICAGGIKGKDSCNGDSGGPLMFLNQTMSEPVYYAIGIVSFGPRDCGSKDLPGVYTKVVDYIPWIISNLRP